MGKFSAQKELVSVTCNIDDLPVFEGLTRCGAAREAQDYCTEDLDAIVVGSMHVHRDRDQVALEEAKAANYFHASKAALAAGVSHGAELDWLGDVFESQGCVVVWVHCGSKGEDWLRLGSLLNPAIIYINR